MHVNTEAEAEAWLKASHAAMPKPTKDGWLCYESPECDCFQLAMPETRGTLANFARALVRIGYDEEVGFGGAAYWLREWDQLAQRDDHVGWRSIELMRRAYGEIRPADVAPVHFFRPDEELDICAFLLPCLVARWDAYLIPLDDSTNGFISIRNGGYCVVAASNLADLDTMRANCRRFGLEPLKVPAERWEQYCRR